MKKRFADELIVGFQKQAAADVPIKESCRMRGFSNAS